MILCINTKDQKVVKVEIRDKGKVISEMSEKNEYGSQALLPLVIKILEKNSLQFTDLKGIEVETGQGSFTGLRVGASVAQALGFALNIPINNLVNKPIDLVYT